MRTWTTRPREEAYLLNPAFCCTTLTAAISSYVSENQKGLFFPLIFIILPIVLHKPTREALPPNTRTSMAAWLHENAEARVLFYERLVSLKPYTREAIQFGMRLGWMTAGKGGVLETTLTESNINKAIQKLADEAHECALRARFVGKWFATSGTADTVMAFWGVRP